MNSLEDNLTSNPAVAEAMAEAPINASPPIPQGGLEVISIAKSYDKRAVLNDISLTVGKGEVLGLLGPNGAGKTTCFYSIMGLVRPDTGRILMFRRGLCKVEAKALVGDEVAAEATLSFVYAG